MKASVVDLRYRTKEILKAIERGETVTLLYRGKEKAQIVPIAQEKTKAKISELPGFGMWKDREDMKDVAAYVRRIRRGRFHDL